MFWKNRRQREFIKQIKETEKEQKLKENNNEGAFVSNTYKQTFYGNKSDKKSNKAVFIILAISLVALVLLVIYNTNNPDIAKMY